MDELKLLIEMVANLPTMAMWVLVGFFAYKVIVIGSIYGLVRFFVDKLHNWLTSPKVFKYKLGDMTINDDVMQDLVDQISRIRDGGSYIHASHVSKLKKAIDEMEKSK